MEDTENIDQNTAQSTTPAVSDSSSAPPVSLTVCVVYVIVATPSTSSTDSAEPATKKRIDSADAPRTLTKDELAGYIERDEFWQPCEAPEGEGDGHKCRGDGKGEPIYDDCDEIRRKIDAFHKQAA